MLYETSCPHCTEFITETLYPTYVKLHKHVDFELVPYGNAVVINANGKEVIDCQHGADECYGNMAQACAMDILQNLTLSMEFVNCMSGNEKSTKISSREVIELNLCLILNLNFSAHKSKKSIIVS